MIESTLKAYNSLRKADTHNTWPELALVAVRVACERLDAEAAERRLAAASNGWVRRRSGAHRLDVPPGPDFGPPLFAEWTEAGGSVSHRLTPHPQEPGALALWTYSEAPGEGAVAALAQDIAVLERSFDVHAPPQKAPLVLYRVYWGAPQDDPAALRRLFARFVGFDSRAEFAGEPILRRAL